MILLVVWSANSGDGGTLPKGDKVNLLSHDTYRLVAAVILWTKRARCALNKNIDLLNKESVSGAHNGRASL